MAQKNDLSAKHKGFGWASIILGIGIVLAGCYGILFDARQIDTSILLPFAIFLIFVGYVVSNFDGLKDAALSKNFEFITALIILVPIILFIICGIVNSFLFQ